MSPKTYLLDSICWLGEAIYPLLSHLLIPSIYHNITSYEIRWRHGIQVLAETAEPKYNEAYF